jgi:hypothetical protein
MDTAARLAQSIRRGELEQALGGALDPAESPCSALSFSG